MLLIHPSRHGKAIIACFKGSFPHHEFSHSAPGVKKLHAKSPLNSEAKLRARVWRTQNKRVLQSRSAFLLSKIRFLQALFASVVAMPPNAGHCLAGLTNLNFDPNCLISYWASAMLRLFVILLRI